MLEARPIGICVQAVCTGELHEIIGIDSTSSQNQYSQGWIEPGPRGVLNANTNLHHLQSLSSPQRVAILAGGGSDVYPLQAVYPLQKDKRSANCMIRASLARVVMLPTAPELKLLFGCPN